MPGQIGNGKIWFEQSVCSIYICKIVLIPKFKILDFSFEYILLKYMEDVQKRNEIGQRENFQNYAHMQ